MSTNNSTDAPANPPCIAPRLIVSAGGHAVTYNAANIDDDTIAEIRQQCDDSDGDISFDLRDLHAWPDVQRYKVLALLRGIGCTYTVSANGNVHANVFAAVLASMIGTNDMAGHEMSMKAAIEAAALWYPAAADGSAQRINDRLEALGTGKYNRFHLAKRIRDAAGQAGLNTAGAESPQALAATYHRHLIHEAEVEPEDPVLVFYRKEFYSWREDHWEPIESELLLANITNFLQTRNLPEVSNRLAHDVLLNLKGIVPLRDWRVAMPFMIDSVSPLSISRPNLLSFANGLVDLDEILNP